ncbi:MAG: HD domain-containing protein [Chloroflexi bacterium]|nr:HD domain-containing protein [Chloroflexota bacterium]
MHAPVIYTDSLYGEEEIRETVLLDLMQTAAVQRLKGVLQHGITGLLGITSMTSRFDHSMGVMILARRLGAPLKEQIAALLHDISHTAFSHVIDYVVGAHNEQSYHEEVKEEYLHSSDVPAALERHGYNWRDFLDEAAYPILEQPAPALCADRLDYFFRDSVDLGLASHEQVIQAAASLVVNNGRVGVQDVEIARWMGYTFMAADDLSWSNFREVGLYELAAQAIRKGIRAGILTEEDFWGTDVDVWGRLASARHPGVDELVKLVDTLTQFYWDEQEPTFYVRTKIRTIDPDVLVDGEFVPLSQLDPEFGRQRQQYVERKNGTWPVRADAVR